MVGSVWGKRVDGITAVGVHSDRWIHGLRGPKGYSRADHQTWKCCRPGRHWAWQCKVGDEECEKQPLHLSCPILGGPLSAALIWAAADQQVASASLCGGRIEQPPLPHWMS